MAEVEAFKVAGVRMFIPSGDHGPPHFHARRPGQWKARVFFMEAEARLFQDVKPPNARIGSSDRKAIIKGIRDHRKALLMEWEACQAH